MKKKSLTNTIFYDGDINITNQSTNNISAIVFMYLELDQGRRNWGAEEGVQILAD